MTTLDDFKKKLNDCIDSISFPNPGVTDREPLRPNEPDGQLEKEGHQVRKELYVGSQVIGGLILAFILLYFIVGTGFGIWEGNGLETIYWYFGGALEDGVQSKPSVFEILIISFSVISYIVSSVFLIIIGSDMQEKERQYYEEIRAEYNKNSLFGKEECLIAKDNNLSDPIITIVVISVISFIASFFIFIDQEEHLNLSVWVTLSILTFFAGVGCLVSLLNIKKYSEGDNEYKCDKYFI